MPRVKTKTSRSLKLPSFTSRDQAAAMKEGWLLDTSENCVVADDDSARFTNNGASDDDAAMAYVVGRADAGCRREIPIRITKAAALDRFIPERVLGDRWFGWDAESQSCSYSHSLNGGCEIGQYLPEDVARELGAAAVGAGDSAVAYEMLLAGFEAPNSIFWTWLQAAHDSLAKQDWGGFVSTMFDVVKSVGEGV